MARRVQELFNLQGKTALVTGGSRGLGWQMAQALGEAGARIVIASRKADDLAFAAQALQRQGIDVAWVAADCAEPQDIQRLVQSSMELLGRIDILVNNAGASWGAPAETHPLSSWDKVMHLNVRGYFLLSQAVAQAGMLLHGGRILNVASIAALGGNPIEMKTIAYNTSKGAVLNFTRALAAEWGPHGITVNAICPSFFRTKMAEGLIDSLGNLSWQHVRPCGRWAMTRTSKDWRYCWPAMRASTSRANGLPWMAG